MGKAPAKAPQSLAGRSNEAVSRVARLTSEPALAETKSVMDDRSRAGFSLIELMIAVAIMGVLAATAITLFQRFQLQGRTAEVKTNLASIRTAQHAYFGNTGVFVAAAAYPAPPESQVKRNWNPAGSGGFETLGWAPEGDVYFTYVVTAQGPANPAFTTAGRGDLDGNGTPSYFAYMEPPDAGVPVPAFGGACAVGVYNPTTLANDRLNTVGACDNLSGRSVY